MYTIIQFVSHWLVPVNRSPIKLRRNLIIDCLSDDNCPPAKLSYRLLLPLRLSDSSFLSNAVFYIIAWPLFMLRLQFAQWSLPSDEIMVEDTVLPVLKSLFKLSPWPLSARLNSERGFHFIWLDSWETQLGRLLIIDRCVHAVTLAHPRSIRPVMLHSVVASRHCRKR